MNLLKCIFAVIQLFLFFCTLGDVAGTKGGSETTNGVTALVTFSDGSPAAGSIVRLRPTDYLSQPPKDHNVVFNPYILTDSQGVFTFSKIKAGDYFIEVRNNGKSLLFSFSINSTDTLDLGTGSLRPSATLNGLLDTIGTGGKQLYAQIRGLERLTRIDGSGTFVFNDLPEGNLDLVISESGSSSPYKEVLNINFISEDTINLMISGVSTYSGLIYIDSLKSELASSDVLTNFPLLIKLDSLSFDFDQAHPDGDDIYFVKADNTPLPHEIEQWDPILKSAAIWVRIDTISGNRKNQFIVMKWGESDIISRSNGASVFDTATGFAGVWHFNEDPSAGEGSIKDRTLNNYNGTPSSSMTVNNIASGMIGDGLKFNGVNDSIKVGMLNLNKHYTLSCWVNPERSPCINWRFIIKEGSYTLWYQTDSGGVRTEHFTDTKYWRGIYQHTTNYKFHELALSKWYHLASTYDGEKIRLFINGEIVDSTETFDDTPHSNDDHPLLFGGRVNEFFKGIMDEVRIEKKARSAEWIKLCYKNQKADGAVINIKMR